MCLWQLAIVPVVCRNRFGGRLRIAGTFRYFATSSSNESFPLAVAVGVLAVKLPSEVVAVNEIEGKEGFTTCLGPVYISGIPHYTHRIATPLTSVLTIRAFY